MYYDAYAENFRESQLAVWEESKSLVEYGLPYQKQNVVDGMAEYLANVGANLQTT